MSWIIKPLLFIVLFIISYVLVHFTEEAVAKTITQFIIAISPPYKNLDNLLNAITFCIEGALAVGGIWVVYMHYQRGKLANKDLCYIPTDNSVKDVKYLLVIMVCFSALIFDSIIMLNYPHLLPTDPVLILLIIDLLSMCIVFSLLKLVFIKLRNIQ